MEYSMRGINSSQEMKRSHVSLRRRKEGQCQKRRIIKRIILISSMNKDTMKVFLKMVECQAGDFPPECREKLRKYSQSILDKDKQKELDGQLDELYTVSEHEQCNECFLRLIKYFILSPVERNYILKIENQLREDEKLDEQIAKVQEQLEQEKMKKLEINRSEVGKLQRDPAEVGKRQKLNHENKLERAHQKLNEICANNNKLRDKINQLRKEKNVMEEIYSKLKKELEIKKQNVEQTIKSAGQAYCARNQAELDLKQLKDTAEHQRQAFKAECQKLNKEIQYDLRFKQFIKSKQKEKESLNKLQEQIKHNEETIQQKKQSNLKIDSEYRESVEKEAQIKKSFDRIKKQIGISEVSIENSGKELLNVFVGLYEKNTIMTNFVNELNRQVQQLELQIAKKKEEIQQACLKGTSPDSDIDKGNEEIKVKLDLQERKKVILKAQYEKSLEAIGLIKQYLQEVFEEIGVDKDTIERLKNSSITQQNLVEFLGQIEKRGLQAISLYSKLVGDQLKAENGDGADLEQHISDLNNIVTYQNSTAMNSNNIQCYRSMEYPSQLILKVKEEETSQDSTKRGMLMPPEDFRKFALESLQNFTKKSSNQLHRDKGTTGKKFTVSLANKMKPKK